MNLLNAFNFKNYNSFRYNGFGTGGIYNPNVSINEFGDSLYVPRTLTFELGMKF